VTPALHALYRVRSDRSSIAERARAIAVEQSVEMPVEPIADEFVRSEIIGRVEAIHPHEEGVFDVRIRLSGETIGDDAGQLMNMLFGNTSLHEDVVLKDVEIPRELAAGFGGPRQGTRALRERAAAPARALTATALKPQGLSPEKLAELAGRFARAGIDYIKDDHGLADQAYARFAQRVAAIQAAVTAAAEVTGRRTRYAPSLSGDLDCMRRQIDIATSAGIDTVLIAPMVAGMATMLRLVRDNPQIAFITHPSMAGAARIDPVLLGKLFRLIGADAIIFPNHGGRFGYSASTCLELAQAARADWHGLRPSLPVPAGGMTRDRVGEMLAFYGADVMLLIGGALLAAGEELVEVTSAFVAQVRNHAHV
jgi:S-methyl-5-thioribulose 1-phosphate isomerase